MMLAVAGLPAAAPAGQALAAPSAAVVADIWPTYQHDSGRSGTAVDQTRFSGAPAHAWTSPVLDGQVYAQPLYYLGQVLVATEANSIYGLRPLDGSVIWRQPLGTAVTSGLPCGNINPVGITGTPVIDTAANVMYVVGTFQLPTIHYELWALDLAGGGPLYHFTLNPPGFLATTQSQRGALALANGKVYIGFGGRAGDCGQYHGVVMSVNTGDATGASLLSVNETSANGGGIWGPAGISVDTNGSLLVSTGNTMGASSTYVHGESVLRLAPSNLSILDSFAPTNWAALDASDLDIGSLAPTLLADKRLVFQAGKNGQGYLLNADALGGIGGQRFTQAVCPGNSEAIGATAYDAGTSTVYVPCQNALQAIHVVGGTTPSFTVSTLVASGGINEPMVAAGAVWDALDVGQLRGFDRSSGQQLVSVPLQGAPTHFAALGHGAGQLFVPEGTRVEAIQLTASAGRDFTLARQAQTPSVLSWSAGGAQVGFFIVRVSNSDAVAVLPSPTSPLPAGATSFVDTSTLTEPGYCYQLYALDASGSTRVTSDAACVLIGSQSATGAPNSFALGTNQSRATPSWSLTGASGYAVLAYPSSGPTRLTTLPSTGTLMIDDTGGLATCYLVAPASNGQFLGNSEVLCVIPGNASVLTTASHLINQAARTVKSGSPAPAPALGR
jgi:hypothetical protein